MLDDLLEWVLGVILEGASEAAGSQRFPMPVRVLLAGILLVFYFGIAGQFYPRPVCKPCQRTGSLHHHRTGDLAGY